MFDIFPVPQPDDIDHGNGDPSPGRRDAHDGRDVGGVEVFTGHDEIPFGNLVAYLDGEVGEGFPEKQDKVPHAVGAFGHAGRSGMIDYLRIDDLMKGGDITLLYKRYIETTHDLLIAGLEIGCVG